MDNIHNISPCQSTDEWVAGYNSKPVHSKPLNTQPATAPKTITPDDGHEGVVVEHALIPPGEYQALYMSHAVKANFKGYGDKLIVEFRISDGEYSDEIIRSFFNIQITDKGWETRGGSRWVKEMRVLLPERKHKDRLPPSLLKGRTILVEVVTVIKGSQKRDLNQSEHYSKVSKLIKIIK